MARYRKAKQAARRRDLRPDRSPLASWVLFDWATQPFYTLVVTFLFAPYFVNGFVGDAALGAALWAYATGGAELIAAIWRRCLAPSPTQGARANLGSPDSQCCSSSVFAGCGSLIQAAPI